MLMNRKMLELSEAVGERFNFDIGNATRAELKAAIEFNEVRRDLDGDDIFVNIAAMKEELDRA